jgi:hypothetical protein
MPIREEFHTLLILQVNFLQSNINFDFQRSGHLENLIAMLEQFGLCVEDASILN